MPQQQTEVTLCQLEGETRNPEQSEARKQPQSSALLSGDVSRAALVPLTYLFPQKGHRNRQQPQLLGCCCAQLPRHQNLSGKCTIRNREQVGPSKTAPVLPEITAIFATVLHKGRAGARLCLGNPICTSAFQQQLLSNNLPEAKTPL